MWASSGARVTARRLYKISSDPVRELLTAAQHLAGQSQPGRSREQNAADARGG
jgi:hypothetical protein